MQTTKGMHRWQSMSAPIPQLRWPQKRSRSNEHFIRGVHPICTTVQIALTPHPLLNVPWWTRKFIINIHYSICVHRYLYPGFLAKHRNLWDPPLRGSPKHNNKRVWRNYTMFIYLQSKYEPGCGLHVHMANRSLEKVYGGREHLPSLWPF